MRLTLLTTLLGLTALTLETTASPQPLDLVPRTTPTTTKKKITITVKKVITIRRVVSTSTKKATTTTKKTSTTTKKPTTTSKLTPIIKATTAPSASRKRGLAWPWDNTDSPSLFLAPTSPPITWLYNWETWTPSKLPSTLPYVPMQRTPADIQTLQRRLVNLSKQRKITHFLGFNEPDMQSQADVGPSEAARLWKVYVNPLKGSVSGLKIGAPAMSNGAAGITWFKDFLKACNGGCTMDFLPLHWYGPPQLSHLQSHISQYHSLLPSLPIWLTEYAPTTWQASNPLPLSTVTQFMRDSTAWLDKTDYIERYAWFVPARSFADKSIGSNILLMTPSGGVSALGKVYAGL
ncbi:hypothetical protein HK097_001084 [Rhizophlyctis rosea]|uniref:Asl1-like glycosyl hydrolase catalytic domain-containing protein n=1 Tax=Rhizophlyctis rosea TaxID=64517 RepID=A0AAD5S4S2_9FUNG|nr:hypothetical protein HK097_001084 [Rhizophlyctis rosea]